MRTISRSDNGYSELQGRPTSEGGQRTSNLDVLIEGYRTRDVSVGGRKFVWQLLDRYVYVDKISELAHVLERLQTYAKTSQDTTTNPSSGGMSGIWAIVHVLAQIHLEFRDSTPFVTQILGCLDQDVRDAVGSVVNDRDGAQTHTVWSERGLELESMLLNHLAAFNSDEGGVGGGALEALRGNTRRLRHSVSMVKTASSAADEEDQMKKRVKTHLLDMRTKPWWVDGAFSRAFCIGLKDLWKAEDYKALLYIMRKADQIRGHSVPQEPFGWTFRMVTLAGPHLRKFGGDSDSFMYLGDRLLEVVVSVLPHFLAKLKKLKAVIDNDLERVHQCHLQILTLMGALMVSVSQVFLQEIVDRWYGRFRSVTTEP